MTIPGRGDLSPPRRHRGYGRRPRRWPRVLVILLVLAALAAGGYYGWHRWHGDDSATVRTAPSPSRCPSVAPRARSALPTAGLTIRLLNGSRNRGRAARVAKQLHTRFGVHVIRVGHGKHVVRGLSVARYPRGKAGQARLVSALVIPRARLVSSKAVKRVELDIGTRFRGVQHLGGYRQVGAQPFPPRASASPGCASP